MSTRTKRKAELVAMIAILRDYSCHDASALISHASFPKNLIELACGGQEAKVCNVECSRQKL
jgi:hypothetical protein